MENKKQKVKDFIKRNKWKLTGGGIAAITLLYIFHTKKVIVPKDPLKKMVENIPVMVDDTVTIFDGCDGKTLEDNAVLILDKGFDFSKIGNQLHFCDGNGVNFTMEVIQFM